MEGWVNPRLGIRFRVQGNDLVLTRPGGLSFVAPEELEARWAETEERARTAERRAQEAESRAERLAARLRELGGIARSVEYL